MRSRQRTKVLSLLALVVLGGGSVVALPACKDSKPKPTIAVGPGVDGAAKDTKRGEDASITDTAKTSKACPAGYESKSKDKAENCACDDECQSGFCSNGVCCTSDCNQACKACNLPSSLGDCAFVPSGVKPQDPSTCTASTPATCGTDGTCDGKGACRKYPKGTGCRTGTCEGDEVTGVMACDGEGNCAPAADTLCPPYTCDSSKNRCASSCTSSAQCSSNQQCVNRRCGFKSNGKPCDGHDDCASGFCADGVCCNTACDGPCVSCKELGSEGRCKPVEAGHPHEACPARDRSTCGTTGLCDGFGACAVFPENTVCKSATCSGPTMLDTSGTCDGKGTCREARLVDCNPYGCHSGACTATCTTDADCAPGVACAKNSAGRFSCGKKQNGQTCKDGSDCASEWCVDGVCCENACYGPCRSCALPGSPGRCVDVPKGGKDPRELCKDEGVASCGRSGLCDGAGACATYPVGQVCASESCVSGSYTPPSMCNTAGQCVAPRSITCSPYLCNGSSCYAACNTDKQCVADKVCANSSCGLKPNGAACGMGGECQSGVCAQGVCCNQTCSDACKACNLPASLGSCIAVEDGAPDPQEKCKALESSTCGTTGKCKAGQCAVFDKGQNCKSASCASRSSQTPASTCDGAGACVTPANLNCGVFVCSGNACKSSCTNDGDCVPPATCVGNSCGLKPTGASCTANGQCLSAHCSEGVCCDSACSDDPVNGLCKSCKVDGRVGTCVMVPAGGSDPKARCAASNPLRGECSRDGTCNGAGACRPWSTSTGCGAANCSAGILSLSVNCDGKGSCPLPAVFSCDPYACSTTSPSCLNTCRNDGDCKTAVPPIKCNLQTNRCGEKLPNGEQCKTGSDCSSGNCIDGICCTSACGGACESCTLAGSMGVCSPIAVGHDPRPNTTTCAMSTGSCGNTGKCDGSRGCEQKTACNDGNACSLTDVCDTAGICVGHDLVTCTPLDACHDAGTCDPSSGTCSNPAKASGAVCDDGNACTRTDACQAGVCVGGNAVVCSASDQCHLAGTCTPGTGLCSDPKKADGALCNDGVACTSGDACHDGVCGGSSYTCAPPDQCHQAGTCKGDGTCEYAPKPNGDPCNDGNACTQTDTCQAGVCTGGNPKVCSASDSCHTAGTCDPATGTCSNPAKSNGDPCDDGSGCTQTDTCQAGVCTGGNPKVCSAIDGCHIAGTCDPATGTCSNPAKSNGDPCDDGNGCTQTDSCQAGVCTGGNPKVCGASDSCHIAGTCDPATGTCSNPAKSNGDPCDDSNGCTQTDTCQAGICTGGNPRVCSASDGCHIAGTCNPATGTCSNPAKPNEDPCDDGNACTQTDTCQAGVCTGTNPVGDGTLCPGGTCLAGVCTPS